MASKVLVELERYCVNLVRLVQIENYQRRSLAPDRQAADQRLRLNLLHCNNFETANDIKINQDRCTEASIGRILNILDLAI